MPSEIIPSEGFFYLMSFSAIAALNSCSNHRVLLIHSGSAREFALLSRKNPIKYYKSVMAEKSLQSGIRKKAMDLLARRDHSEQELRRKLKSREYDADTIDEVLQELISDRLQSDERFTEAYVNHRFNAGVGPLKIR